MPGCSVSGVTSTVAFPSASVFTSKTRRSLSRAAGVIEYLVPHDPAGNQGAGTGARDVGRNAAARTRGGESRGWKSPLSVDPVDCRRLPPLGPTGRSWRDGRHIADSFGRGRDADPGLAFGQRNIIAGVDGTSREDLRRCRSAPDRVSAAFFRGWPAKEASPKRFRELIDFDNAADAVLAQRPFDRLFLDQVSIVAAKSGLQDDLASDRCHQSRWIELQAGCILAACPWSGRESRIAGIGYRRRGAGNSGGRDQRGNRGLWSWWHDSLLQLRYRRETRIAGVHLARIVRGTCR